MKKLILLTAISMNVAAHGHYPQQLGSVYVYEPMHAVEFNLSNAFKQTTCFDIEVNSHIIVPLQTCLSPNQTKKMKVWVRVKPDVPTHQKVCSIANNKKGMNTRMCTEVNTHYPFTYLSEPE